MQQLLCSHKAGTTEPGFLARLKGAGWEKFYKGAVGLGRAGAIQVGTVFWVFPFAKLNQGISNFGISATAPGSLQWL